MIIFIATLFITLGIVNSSSPKDVQIPNVVGKTQEEAKIEIEKNKLIFNVSKEVFSSDVEKGSVVSQDPEYKNNYSIKEGNTINVVISKGIELVKMPKVVGVEYSKAETTLTDLGLKIEKIEEISQTVEAGYIVNQETAENTEIAVGSTVKIHVSKGNGKKKFKVIDVIGKNRDEAKKSLTDLGMEVSIKEKEDTSKSDGVVLEQSIQSDTEVEEGTKITITVNKIQADVKGTVNVKVKKLADTYAPDSDDSEEKNIKVKVIVGSDTICDRSVDRNTENLNLTFESKGIVNIKVYINGILVNGKSYTMDLNSDNTVLTVG